MKTIPLTKGKEALVDDEDYPFLIRQQWHFGQEGYAAAKLGTAEVKMHVLVMGNTISKQNSNWEIDHINGNRLDNRKDNLRWVTRQQNCFNSAKRKGTTSKYKGVSWARTKERWRATITVSQKQEFLGYFKDEDDAARAYDRAAAERFGEFARLNFPVI